MSFSDSGEIKVMLATQRIFKQAKQYKNKREMMEYGLSPKEFREEYKIMLNQPIKLQ